MTPAEALAAALWAQEPHTCDADMKVCATVIYDALAAAGFAIVPANTGEAVDYDAMRVAREWPTPNHMRKAAEALDLISPARYGDVLRWFADRCDDRVWHLGDPEAGKRLDRARSNARLPEEEGQHGEG